MIPIPYSPSPGTRIQHESPLHDTGIPNLHSHAFQRAMAGLTERQTNPTDSFWTWRELMYKFAAKLTPDSLRAVAAQAYVEDAGGPATKDGVRVPLRAPPPRRKPYADPTANVAGDRAGGARHRHPPHAAAVL